MRFVHTADWHLGRIFNGVHLTEEQAHVLLGEFLDFVRDARPDAVVMAGDVFDRAIPPPEAVELFDEILCRLALGLRVPVIVIAGNHDSPRRIGFASRLLRGANVHLVGALERQGTIVELADAHGPVFFHAVPYAEPAEVAACLGAPQVTDHASAMREVARSVPNDGRRRVLIAHAYVAGGIESESERPLAVGGAGLVQTDCFGEPAYVALGHLHRRQHVAGAIHYCGSPLKYSFSEADHRKGINLVEMDAAGMCKVTAVPLTPRRDVRCIEGTLAQVLADGENDPAAHDYLRVTLRDEGVLLDPIGKLRRVYPNVLAIERPFLAPPEIQNARRIDPNRFTALEVFAAFMEQVVGQSLTPPEQTICVRMIEQLRFDEREDAEEPRLIQRESA